MIIYSFLGKTMRISNIITLSLVENKSSISKTSPRKISALSKNLNNFVVIINIIYIFAYYKIQLINSKSILKEKVVSFELISHCTTGGRIFLAYLHAEIIYIFIVEIYFCLIPC